ncbi:MAG: MarR family winged helix-turn-helix transcriptional regulator [Desulfuromonadales bacterium]
MMRKPRNSLTSAYVTQTVVPLTDNPDLATDAIPKSCYDLRILQSLRRIIRSVDLHSRKLLMQRNITGPQLACLLAMNEHGRLTATSLAREVHLSPSTIVGILDRLEQKALVERHRSSQDRRVVILSITQAGRELAEAAPSPLQETLSNSLRSLPEIEQVSITLSLEKIVALMEAGTLDAVPALVSDPLIPLIRDKTEEFSKT